MFKIEDEHRNKLRERERERGIKKLEKPCKFDQRNVQTTKIML